MVTMLITLLFAEFTKADRDLNFKLDLKEFTGVYASFANLSAAKK